MLTGKHLLGYVIQFIMRFDVLQIYVEGFTIVRARITEINLCYMIY